MCVGIMGENMNTKNNKRRRASQEKIEKAFIELLQSREIKEITVSVITNQFEKERLFSKIKEMKK